MNNNTYISIGGHQKILTTKILMLKADINYTYIHFVDGSYMLTSTAIGVLEKRLSGFNFFRTHRSTIINLQYLSDFDYKFKIGSSSTINLINGTKIPLSRRKIAVFLKTIKYFISLT
ncbi:LytR/AlgR family response regulator transcription factor [Emticicia sp. SJ17W-69]|uniref:LytR/AlgR family response regulator transcription factor n=1 Tax=Emticicia sp. SJ17W-69 TaxID=3421657 RepID=UPI003EBD265E